MREEPSYASILSNELYERLRWFGRLRWLAIATLAAASLVGPLIGAPAVWPGLFFVALVAAVFNLYFQLSLRRPGARDRSLGHWRSAAIVGILLDLAGLLVTVHYTGGLRSPVLPFFVFHMAIGPMILPLRTVFLIAGAIGLGTISLYLVEVTGALAQHPLDLSITKSTGPSDVTTVSLIATVFCTVYLVGRVTRQSDDRMLRLHEATAQLRGKTGELQGALDEIQDLERRKSHYMRISAHQLRSPLGTIRTSLKVLTSGIVAPTSERGGRLLSGVEERVDGLLAIVNDLLELAKIREGQNNAPWTPDLDLRGLLLDIVESVRPDTDGREIRLDCDLGDGAVLAWGVPTDLRFALENLVSNAIKYSNDGGNVRVGLDVVTEKAKVTVADDGIGIPDDLQRDVFLEFVRAPNAKRHASQGTGLGLAIVKETIEMHGGTVSLRSREGEGSTFELLLPLQNEAARG